MCAFISLYAALRQRIQPRGGEQEVDQNPLLAFKTHDVDPNPNAVTFLSSSPV